jgi:hypothetical protein
MSALPTHAVLVVLAHAVLPALQGDGLAQIQVDPPSIDFGECGHSERPVQRVTVRNAGPGAVAIRQIHASCGCIEVSPPSLGQPIPPGGSASFDVSMGSGRAMGLLEKHVEIVTSDPRSPLVVLPVKMKVFPGLSMEPRELRFEEGVVGGAPIRKSVDVVWGPRVAPRPFVLRVEEVRNLSGSKGRSPHFEAKVLDLPNGKRIELTLLPTHPEGRIWAELDARLDGRRLEIPVAGEMFRWIKVVPTYFNFSAVSEGKPESFFQEVTLSSTDDRKFRILEATPTFRGYSAKDARLEVAPRDGKLGDEASRHVLRARIVPPPKPVSEPSTGGAAPKPAGAAAKSDATFSGTVTVKTTHPDKPEIILSFFGFFASPRR